MASLRHVDVSTMLVLKCQVTMAALTLSNAVQPSIGVNDRTHDILFQPIVFTRIASVVICI
jgi:hypothetical protein